MTKQNELAKIEGLTFSDCVQFFAGRQTKREKNIAAFAKEHLHQEETCEIDDLTILSEGDDNGTYVLAWSWLSFYGTRWNKRSIA